MMRSLTSRLFVLCLIVIFLNALLTSRDHTSSSRTVTVREAFGDVVASPISFMSAARQGAEGWKLPANAKETKNPIKATPESVAKGKELYKTNCQMCHGEKGDGQGPMAANLQQKPGNFTDKNLMGKFTDGELFWMISKGKLPMPGYEKTLSKENIWHIVNYIRTFAK